jgi:aminodeoxyfutalosine deaminase
MKRLAAHYLFDGNELIKYGVIELDNNGTILSVSKESENVIEKSGLSFYNGILIPGMINMHCHLELAGMKKSIPENTGLAGFISSIINFRLSGKPTFNEIAMKKADSLMYSSGIVAVADICNTDLSINVKLNSKLYYHNFIECMGISENQLVERFFDCSQTINKFKNLGLSASITPHAIYSLHPDLFKRVLEIDNDSLSLHIFESSEESNLYSGADNKLFRTLKDIENRFVVPDINNSIAELVKCKSKSKILVHNVDVPISIANTIYCSETVFPCLCPNSNLFISNKLPDIEKLMSLNENIVVGTDSLASNHELSLISELYSISIYYPDINLVEMLKWVTSNGARALGVQQKFGSFTIGTKPGVVLLSNLDLQSLSFTKETYSKRII